MESMGQIVLGAGVTAGFHPISYVKTLIQIGYEPLDPQLTTTLFGSKVLCYPNVFKYLGHIKKTDGFLGLYRGLGPRLAGGIVGSMVTNAVSLQVRGVRFQKGLTSSDSSKELDGDEDIGVVADLKRLCKDSSCEVLARCAGVIASQPFHVIMIRSMAQFAGKETIYSNTYSAVLEIYNKEGILGFFAGLIPRLLGEMATIWLANVLAHVINTYIIPKTQGSSDMKNYTNAICALMVTQVTYPFSLVSNVMAVNGCGLAAGSPPNTALHSGWRACWRHLSRENALKRGSSLFFRYYKGPVTFMHGVMTPAGGFLS